MQKLKKKTGGNRVQTRTFLVQTWSDAIYLLTEEAR